MLTALISFLGSAFFRAAFERVFAWLEKKQDHEQEMERMRLQFSLDERRAQLQLAGKQVEWDAQQEVTALKALAAAQASEAVQTGVAWVDTFRAVIRPGAASILILFYVVARGVEMYAANTFGMTEFDMSLIAAVFGFYFTDRTISKRLAQ